MEVWKYKCETIALIKIHCSIDKPQLIPNQERGTLRERVRRISGCSCKTLRRICMTNWSINRSRENPHPYPGHWLHKGLQRVSIISLRITHHYELNNHSSQTISWFSRIITSPRLSYHLKTYFLLNNHSLQLLLQEKSNKQKGYRATLHRSPLISTHRVNSHIATTTIEQLAIRLLRQEMAKIKLEDLRITLETNSI